MSGFKAAQVDVTAEGRKPPQWSIDEAINGAFDWAAVAGKPVPTEISNPHQTEITSDVS
jgi:hypothetical protein